MTGDINIFRYDDVDVTLQDATCATVEVRHHVNVRKTIWSRGSQAHILEHPDTPWDPKAVSAEELFSEVSQAAREASAALLADTFAAHGQEPNKTEVLLLSTHLEVAMQLAQQ